MAAEKTTQAMTDGPTRSPLLLILALAACVGVAAFSFYLGLQKSAIQEEQKHLDGEIVSLQNEIKDLEDQKVEAAQQAQKWLENIEKTEIRWSGVITRINSLIPRDVSTQEHKVKFMSYSGQQGGKISLNGQTRETDGDPYPDVAELVEVFNDSSYFSNAYVPSATRGETDQGKKIASFVFSTLYHEETPEISTSTSSDESDESAETSTTETSAPSTTTSSATTTTTTTQEGSQETQSAKVPRQ